MPLTNWLGLWSTSKAGPLADVTVDAFSWYPGNETTTNEKGLFRLKKLDPSHTVQLLIKKDGYSPRMITSRKTGSKDSVVILQDRTYFEGIVTDAGKKPVKGARVLATCGPFSPNPGYMITEIPLEAISDDDGKYRLYVFPNLYDIKVSAAGRGVSRETGVTIEANERTDHPIQLEKGVRFDAIVVDSVTEKPVEGFALFRWAPPLVSATSNAQGKLVLEDLFPGEIAFNCGAGKKKIRNGAETYEHGPLGRWWSPEVIHDYEKFQIDKTNLNWQRNFDGLTFHLEPDMKPITIIVEQGVTITGQVTDPDGNPVKGATVAPALSGTGNSLTGDTRYSVRSDAEGKYRVVLPASNEAEYNLVVHDGNYNQWRNWANGVSNIFQTKPGQVIENLDLKLTKPALVRGKVTSFGNPVANREVRSHDFEKRENRYYDPTVKTKADGTFELKFVRPGKHYVQAAPFSLDASNAEQKWSVIVEVEAGDVIEDIELQVEGK